MNKEELLFYKEYEMFYAMADHSEVFKEYCEKAFGADFSQDGFSDVSQLNEILNIVTITNNSKVLDVGCGNGKMLRYIKQKTGAYITGFDFSEKAIETANKQLDDRSDFQVGVIGEIEYSHNTFDVIFSMDTIYFAKDMKAFVTQLYQWLKKGGYFICGYQEGDVMKKTLDKDTTVLAEVLKDNGIEYIVIDYTRKTYEMLKNKRYAILSMKDKFIDNGLEMWYQVVEGQTQRVIDPFEKYEKENARYIYIIIK